MAEDEACKAIFWSPNFNSTPPPTPRKSWEVKVSQQRRPLKIPVALLVRGPFLRIFMRRHVGSQNQKRDSWAPYWLVVILNELGHCGSRDCNVHKKKNGHPISLSFSWVTPTWLIKNEWPQVSIFPRSRFGFHGPPRTIWLRTVHWQSYFKKTIVVRRCSWVAQEMRSCDSLESRQTAYLSQLSCSRLHWSLEDRRRICSSAMILHCGRKSSEIRQNVVVNCPHPTGRYHAIQTRRDNDEPPTLPSTLHPQWLRIGRDNRSRYTHLQDGPEGTLRSWHDAKIKFLTN